MHPNFLLLYFCEVCSTEYEAEPGDVNFDGRVDASDARLILRASVGLEDKTQWMK